MAETHVIIDNCIISQEMGSIICIRPIHLAIKLNPTLDISKLRVITTGSRRRDNDLIRELIDGTLTFNNLLLY